MRYLSGKGEVVRADCMRARTCFERTSFRLSNFISTTSSRTPSLLSQSLNHRHSDTQPQLNMASTFNTFVKFGTDGGEYIWPLLCAANVDSAHMEHNPALIYPIHPSPFHPP
jgi:hypothetical protein